MMADDEIKDTGSIPTALPDGEWTVTVTCGHEELRLNGRAVAVRAGLRADLALFQAIAAALNVHAAHLRAAQPRLRDDL